MNNAEKIETLHPKIRQLVKNFLLQVENELRLQLKITHAFRSFKIQQQVYDKGRIHPGKIVSYAKPGQSYHNYGLAFDVKPDLTLEEIEKFPYWDRIGRIGISLGLEWGGNFKNFYDKRHFQKSFGYHHTELLELLKSNNLNGLFVNI